MINRSYITLVKSTGCYKMQTAWNPACVQCNQCDFECVAGPGIFFSSWKLVLVVTFLGLCHCWLLPWPNGFHIGHCTWETTWQHVPWHWPCHPCGGGLPDGSICSSILGFLCLVVVPFWDLPSPLELAPWLCPLEGSLGAHVAWVPWPWLAWLP